MKERVKNFFEIHLWLALAVFVVLNMAGCMSGTQQYALHSQRIAAEREIAMRPILKADSAQNVEVYDAKAGITPIPNQLKEWLEFGEKMGWIGLGAYGIYEFSGHIKGNTKHTTNNYNNVEVAP